MLGFISKVVGALCIIVGGILIFSLLLTKNQSTFLIALIGGPVLIYLGLKLLSYI